MGSHLDQGRPWPLAPNFLFYSKYELMFSYYIVKIKSLYYQKLQLAPSQELSWSKETPKIEMANKLTPMAPS